MIELVLVRHGSTDWNEQGLLQGCADVPLNATGRRQATKLRSRLAGRNFEGMWTSDLSRAVETARIAFGPGVAADPRLRELDCGRLDGLRWDEIPLEHRQGLIAFDGFVAPGGESVASLRARVIDFLSHINAGENRGGEHLVVTHGGVIRLLLRMTGRDDREPGYCQPIELGVPEEMLEGGGSGGNQ